MGFDQGAFSGGGGGGGGGGGDVTGPASSTDNALVRFDGTTGKIVQGSGVTLDDSDNMLFPLATQLRFRDSATYIHSLAANMLLLGAASTTYLLLRTSPNAVQFYKDLGSVNAGAVNVGQASTPFGAAYFRQTATRGRKQALSVLTSSTTLTTDHERVVANINAGTLTLPQAPASGSDSAQTAIEILNVHATALTIAAGAGDSLHAAAPTSLPQGKSCKYIYSPTGTTWYGFAGGA